jgi:ring-1,2-phenylacetyl-CoA epoxidase subunit PaaE
LPSRLNALGLGNRIGFERLLTPLALYQNYHLVHHLHPAVPFYRYIAVWRRNEERYLERNPALSTVRGRPLTASEYRRLRELEH